MQEVKIVLEVDDKGSIKVKQFGDESKKAFDQMQKGPQAAQGPLASLKESWVGLTTKIAAATAVVYGVGKAFSSFVNEAAEAEQIENRLRYALEITGYTWQYAKTAVDQFANSVQASTRFSDEQARQALTDMMMYTNDFAKAQMGAKLAMDMSIRTGQDLGSTSRLIGMAMSGNVEMLGRYIPSLKNVKDRLGENATATQIWEYALKELQKLFGGTAQADIDSYAGKVAQFKNAWSDFKEKIGNELLPPLKELLDTLKNITKEITKEIPYKEIPLAKFWGMEITRRIPYKGEELQELLLQRQRVAAFQSQGLAAETKKDKEPVDPKKWDQAIKAAAEYGKAMSDVEQVVLSFDLALSSTGITLDQYKERMKFAKDEEAFWNEITQEAIKLSEELGSYDLSTSVYGTSLEGISGIWKTNLDESKKYWEEQISEALKASEGLRSYDEALSVLGTNTAGYWKIQEDMFKKTVGPWQSLAENISSVWASNMVNMIRSTESTAEKIKGFFQSMADVFLSAVSKMITQWLIFGSITGKKEENASWLTGSFWSGLLGSIFKFTPTASGSSFLQGGMESPLKSGKIPAGMGGNGKTELIVNIINQAPNTKVEHKESQDGRGNRDITVVISEIIAREVGRVGSPVNKSIGSMGGANELIRR